jgi:hypothetical protein
MFNLIIFVFLETQIPTVGQIYILRRSVEQVFECTLEPSTLFGSSNSLAPSSLVTSSTTTKSRLCLVWNKKPKIQVLLIPKHLMGYI